MTARDELYEALLGHWTPRTGSMTPDELIEAYAHELAQALSQAIRERPGLQGSEGVYFERYVRGYNDAHRDIANLIRPKERP